MPGVHTAQQQASVVPTAYDGRRTSSADNGAVPSAPPTTAPAQAVHVAAAASLLPRQTTSGVEIETAGSAPLLRSKLARRFLAAEAAGGAEEAGTDGAGRSCQSHSVHINCPPASSKP